MADAEFKIYACNEYIGGGLGALDKLAGPVLKDKDKAVVINETTFSPFHLDADSGADENSPLVIKPDVDAGDKRFLLKKGVFAGLTVYGTITLPSTNKINFRDSDISISSPYDGTLDIGADISVDFFYDNADVGDAVDGQKVCINRRAGEGDDFISLYVDKDRKGLIGFNGVDDLLQLATTGLTVNGKLRVEGADANQKIAEFVGDDASHNRICICGPIDADSQLSFMHGGSAVWSIGNNANNDAFVIRTGAGAFGTNDKFTILSNGGALFTGNIGCYGAGARELKMESSEAATVALKIINTLGSYGFYVSGVADKFVLYDYGTSTIRQTIAGGNFCFGTGTPKSKITVEGIISLQEQAADITSVATFGQVWVKNDVPCILKFTNDINEEFSVVVSDGDTGGTGSAGAGKQYVEIEIAGTVYKVLHDGTV